MTTTSTPLQHTDGPDETKGKLQMAVNNLQIQRDVSCAQDHIAVWVGGGLLLMFVRVACCVWTFSCRSAIVIFTDACTQKYAPGESI